MQQSTNATVNNLTQRQKDVLDAALHLLVKNNQSLTMSKVAETASCSKETLYKWFGDRNSFLETVVEWQASRVRVVPVSREAVDEETLFNSLEHFARDWLMVLTSPTSIALNRLAISQAGSGKSNLGNIVLYRGPFAMARRLKPILEIGRDCGLLEIDDLDNAFRTFFGLVVRDVQIRKLLGDDFSLKDEDIIREARIATRQFFALYGQKKPITLEQTQI
ncbi:TetR/AcrR family transcriptional regulator C-terminal domain-containing protein [uncultured Bartonella sp.]|uniref:TetR/AcrR family transcriptional regulator n=1 Tax=uncultured Bartonella sp. TaxID=104108 RepID=UPI002628EB24|nr:TetR/AcrR family transcriptional regulator C-terminal domain-containing protein [uncultured Bartonella sp.]